MTVADPATPPAPRAARDAGPEADVSRRSATAADGPADASPTRFLIGYALLMLVPFAWQVITSFKTQPDALRADDHPGPVHARRAGRTAS